MIHHSNEKYDVALGKAGKRFQAKLDDAINATQASAMSVIEKVQRETPNDRLAHSQALTFAVGPDGNILMGLNNRQAPGYFQEGLHKHALQQVADRAGIPTLYLNRLLDRPYGAELIVENLSTIFRREDDKKFLVRSVNDQVRGVVSDSFRRMDSGPIIESFASACESIGAVPIEGTGGDLRWAIKAILPKVFQPPAKAGAEEMVAFGLQLANSDFGCGKLAVSAFCTRLVCTNHATFEQLMSQVHLGKRLTDDLEYSMDTYAADTQTQVLAVRDVVQHMLAPKKVHELVGRIGAALDARIDPKQAWAELPKLGLLKGEVEKVKELFNDAGVEQLPPGTSPARLSNAVSWFAKSAATPERKLELEALAGHLMSNPVGLKAAA